MKHFIITFVAALLIAAPAGAAGSRLDFTLSGQSAFRITPTTAAAGNRWIAYAPALGGLPAWNSGGGGGAEQWMFDHYLANGIAIAGIYAGDLSGNTDQRVGYTNLYNEMTINLGYAEQFSFHTRSPARSWWAGFGFPPSQVTAPRNFDSSMIENAAVTRTLGSQRHFSSLSIPCTTKHQLARY